ncbi:ABC transporter permease subunit [Paenibacillus agricola]|uniref:ABC transporter permease subunit n=1 Tax=Paenibacillus agricola TaxID=2716264 RepID=A0ABX0J7X2_9BACL|nr:ABC transporter permease subunit [Paenibacillus agricola]NHN30943.1 ABC transporter permease subunit [Paenibacillus agricola]
MITIIAMTWKEMLRKRVMLLTLLMTGIFLLAFWFVAQTIGIGLQTPAGGGEASVSYLIERFKLGAIIIALGFFFGSFVTAFLSIFSSFSSVAGEAEQGVLLALLPRPLARWRWYMGRWIGYVTLGGGYSLLIFVSILLIARFHAAIPLDLLLLVKAFLLFAWTVPLLVSVSMLGSCIFSALGNGVFMTMLFGAGWLGGMIEKVAGSLLARDASLQPLKTIAGLMSLVMPADAIQQRMLSEMFSLSAIKELMNINDVLGPFGLGQEPTNAFLLYTACYTLAALGLGLWVFQRKDL